MQDQLTTAWLSWDVFDLPVLRSITISLMNQYNMSLVIDCHILDVVHMVIAWIKGKFVMDVFRSCC